jgi:hypothetical protein
MRRKKLAMFEGTADNKSAYLNYLTALRKFFTNDEDIIPVIFDFNFYVNGVYGIPYLDLFRNYEENLEDIHGSEKTKALTDDGTIGLINEMIYKIGNGSLIASLEAMRMIIIDKTKTFYVVYNPFFNAYTEAPKPQMNNLGNDFPEVVSNGGYKIDTGTGVKGPDYFSNQIPTGPQKVTDTRTTGNVIAPTGPATPKATKSVRQAPINTKKKKSIWSYLSWAVYKPKPKPINTGNGGYL